MIYKLKGVRVDFGQNLLLKADILYYSVTFRNPKFFIPFETSLVQFRRLIYSREMSDNYFKKQVT